MVTKVHKAYMAEYRRTHKDERRVYNLKHKYGLLPKEYDVLLESQNGVCAICKQSSSTLLQIDHDHGTDEIRGLLCHACNTTLGLLKENVGTLYAMTDYIQVQPNGFIGG